MNPVSLFYRERRDSGGRLSKLLRRTVLGHALLLPRRSQLDLVLPVPLRAAAVGSRALRHVRVWLGLHRRKFASFALGAPVKPFLQQLSCLPPQSQSILPASYRVLVSAKSPVAEFYPTHFAIDMNNKKNPWEGVNLIPFIDIDRLTDAMDALHVDAGLSPEEQKRNAFQGPQLFQYAAKASGSYSFPFKSAVFRGIAQVHCAVRTTAIGSPSDKQENVLRLRPLEDTSVLDLTTYRTQERGVGILCAGRDSRQSTVVVKIPARLQDEQINTETLTQLVKNCKNRVVCYPLWRKHYALIEGIYVSNYYVSLKQENTSFIVPLYPNKIEKIKGMMQRVVKEALQGRLSVLGLGGVDLETVNVLLELHPIIGVKRDRLTGELHYRFASQNQLFPLQLVKPVSVITSPVFNFPDKVSIWQPHRLSRHRQSLQAHRPGRRRQDRGHRGRRGGRQALLLPALRLPLLRSLHRPEDHVVLHPGRRGDPQDPARRRREAGVVVHADARIGPLQHRIEMDPPAAGQSEFFSCFLL